MFEFVNIGNDCDFSSIGGINSIFVKERKTIGKFWYYNQTANYQFGEIIGHSGTNNYWNRLLFNLDSGAFNQTETITPSRLYTQILKLQFNRMSIYNRDKFEQMVVCNDLVILFEDLNGKWWLMGESYGCRATFSGQTDGYAGNNLFELTFGAKERYPIRAVSQSYIDTNLIVLEPLCQASWDNLCVEDWITLCNSPWN